MEEVDPHVEAAALWLAQTILEVLFAGKMEAWIRQVGLADDTEMLKSEIERVEAVVGAVKGRAAESRPLARSLGRLKELVYDADDMVDELDYYRHQHQVEEDTIDWDDQAPGTDATGGAQLVEGSRDNSGLPNRNDRKKRSKAWGEFSITEEDADGKPLKAECIYCHTVVRCETTKGTSVLHNHLKSENCKRKRAAIEQTPNPSSAQDSAQNGATISTHDPDGRKRMRSDEVLAHNTAANTHLWNKAEFCNRIQQTTHKLLKAISEVQKLYGLTVSVASSNLCQNTVADPCRRTSSIVQRKMYGRVAEKNSIIKFMTGDESDSVIIIPIVGIGGIGKTALAQFIYNDPIVKTQFDYRIWIWVSSKFDEVRITMDMLDFVSQEKYIGISSLAKLQEILVTHITSKRTLLVLDDVWDGIDDSRWKKLLAPLMSDNMNGNVILVTTRKLSIAKRICTVKSVMLGAIQDDDFWLLFKTCAFGDENYKEHPSLNIIGREIVEKLQGNPLAAETAGMLLREYLTIDHWINILKSEKWKSLELNGGIMHSLKLSYDELPYYVQQCFLYCSIFPNNHQFLCKELINIWISQGFLKCGHSTVRLEEIGRNHLNDLVNSGFFEQVETETQDTTPDGHTCYVVSGLMHDFARQLSRTLCTIVDGVEYTRILPSVRHLSIVTDATYHKDQSGNILPNFKFEKTIRSITAHVSKLRTLVLIGKYDSLFFQFINNILQKAHCLRLLQITAPDADCASFLCDSVTLAHLRYLKLENNGGDGALSQSLKKLYHLQVLDVGKFRCLDTHYNMNCLVSLRHLNVPKGMHPSISGISKLTSLQELHGFSVEGSSGWKITELQFMNELLQLEVSQLQDIGTADEACGARLRDKQHLEKLHLSWKDILPQDEYDSEECSVSEDESGYASEECSELQDENSPASNFHPNSEYCTDTARDVLEGLEPYRDLKHLRVSGYTGSSSPAWLGTSVTCLQTLHLEDCGQWKILPSLGRLPFLAKLELRNMQSVIEVSLPSLEEVVLIKMPKLEICSCNSISDLNSRLTALKIKRCSVLKAFPLFESCDILNIEHKSWLPRLTELTMYMCPRLKVSNPLPPSNKVCKLDILGVSTLPTMERSSNGKLIIGRTIDEVDEEADVYSDELIKLDGNILSFRNLRALARMEIACCQNLTSISLEGFRQLTSLKSLEIQFCKDLFSSEVLPQNAREGMSDANFNALPSLELLRIISCGITGKWLSVLLRHALTLEELDLYNCYQISGLLIEEKGRSLSNHTSTPWASSAGNLDGTLTSSTPDGLLRIPSNLIPSLKKISIVYCEEITFEGNKEGFSGFTSLEELIIEECPKLIPSLVHKCENSDQGNGRWLLPCSLRELNIDGGHPINDSLETLQLCFLENRNCLRRLKICSIPSLKYLDLRSCTGLEEMTINSCKSFTTLEANFTCLRKLALEKNPTLTLLQLRFYPALEDLRIQFCESLDALEDFQFLRGLRYLDVLKCPALTPYLERLSSQSYELCPGLERLRTDDDTFLTTSFCKPLTSLRCLEFNDCTWQATRLTDEQEGALQLLTSLQELRFQSCSNLADLPVGLHGLSSLKRLEIGFCSRISRLPEKGLPPLLEELEMSFGCSKELIDECRMLATRRSKPKVKIAGEYVN